MKVKRSARKTVIRFLVNGYDLVTVQLRLGGSLECLKVAFQASKMTKKHEGYLVDVPGGKSAGCIALEGAQKLRSWLICSSSQADENPDPLLDVVQQYPIEVPPETGVSRVKLVETKGHGDRMASGIDFLTELGVQWIE